MIQPTILPAQPTPLNVQAAPTQQTDPNADSTTTFQSMLQQSSNKLGQGETAKGVKTGKAKPNVAEDRESDKTATSLDAQMLQALQAAQGVNASLIGNVSTPLNSVVPQLVDGTQQTADFSKIGAVAVNTVDTQNIGTAMLMSKGMQANMPTAASANNPSMPFSTAQIAAQNTNPANVVATPNIAAENVIAMPNADTVNVITVPNIDTANTAAVPNIANIAAKSTPTEIPGTVSAVAPNAPAVQSNLAVQMISQSSPPAVQQAAEQKQTILPVTVQAADPKANQPIPAQYAVVDTPVPSQTILQAAQTVDALNQNLQEKLTAQAFDAPIQAAQTKQTELPVAVKAADIADEKSSANQHNTAGYAELFQSGKVVIPISDSSTNVQKSVPTQLTDTITTNLQSGKQEFQVDLFPKDLGRVSVKLASENGILTVEIMASNPKTQSMLLSSSSEIKSILQASVNQPVQVVDASQNKQAYNEQQQNSQSNAQQQQQQEENRQQHRNYSMPFDNDDNSISTVDFLSVMRQLSVNV